MSGRTVPEPDLLERRRVGFMYNINADVQQLMQRGAVREAIARIDLGVSELRTLRQETVLALRVVHSYAKEKRNEIAHHGQLIGAVFKSTRGAMARSRQAERRHLSDVEHAAADLFESVRNAIDTDITTITNVRNRIRAHPSDAQARMTAGATPSALPDGGWTFCPACGARRETAGPFCAKCGARNG